MSQNQQVVDGEASESDSEVEVGKSPDLDSSSNKKEFVIVGEAPESDEEFKKPLPPPPRQEIPDLPVYTLLETPVTLIQQPVTNMYNSLLHQKLWEANVSFRANLDGLVKHTTDVNVEKLTTVDKTLLSVQESMRATNANLTLARARIKQLREQLEKANCASALPTVKT